MAKFIIFIVLFMQACGTESANTAQRLPNDSETKENTNSIEPDQAIIVLDRRFGECLGQCPVYRISVHNTGKIVYEGKENVKTKGLVESEIDRSEVEKLVSLFENAQFFKLKEKYVRGENCSNPVLSDSHNVYLSFSDGKAVKSVLHYQGCLETTNPSEVVNKDLNILHKLEESVDKTVNSKQWIN